MCGRVGGDLKLAARRHQMRNFQTEDAEGRHDHKDVKSEGGDRTIFGFAVADGSPAIAA